MRLAGCCLALGLLAVSIPAQEIALKPFSIDYRAGGSVIDLSFLLDPPAGKNGFIRIEGGHFAKPDGSRFRIWGVDITDFARGSVHFPPKDDAALWAGVLARMGVNCVRLHYFDAPPPKGILAAGRGGTLAFDPEQLDRLDSFIAQLKKRGIYCDLNLNVGRRYNSGDGVHDYDLIGSAKALTYFDPRLIELQEEYAQKLLTHYNPYTKSEYRNEPAIAIIELVNENTITGAWVRGRLAGTKTSGPAAEWQDIPPYYEHELTALYNAWLARKLPAARIAALRKEAGVAADAPVPRLRSEQFDAASKERFETEASFYMELESNFFRDMRAFLKQTLGCRALLIGTSDYSYGHSAYPLISSELQLDIIDAHGPWENKPMVAEPLNSIPVRLSRAVVAGKPCVVTEHNHRFPNPYTSEGIPLVAAYGAFQDWDGIFLYTFETKPRGYVPFIGSRADLSHDPIKLPNLAAGALMFLRPDIAKARETVARSYSAEQVRESLRLPSSEGVYFTPGFSASVALRHESRIASLDGAPTQPLAYPDGSSILSDTGELSWYFGAKTGMATVDTARTQALIGFLSSYEKATRNLSASIRNRFATLVLASLDSKPIAQSARLLLTAGARDANTNGGPPTVIEPVTGRAVLRGLDRAAAVELSPLDGAGRPMGEPIAAKKVAAGWEIALGNPVTTWYEIRVKRN